MKEITCCFSGHRRIPQALEEEIFQRLCQAVQDLAEEGYLCFCAGGALGFDTIAAQAVLKARETLPDIRLILLLPCRDQPRLWRKADKARYYDILSMADEVIYVSQSYDAGCMLRRNRRLVEHSSACVCWLTEPEGGTAYTVAYARAMGLRIINLAKDMGAAKE